LKNKRSYGYRQGRLDVPEKYQYLKNYAAQRSQTLRGNTHKRKAAQAKGRKRKQAKGKETKAVRTAIDVDIHMPSERHQIASIAARFLNCSFNFLM
jgi:hypothetical protein